VTALIAALTFTPLKWTTGKASQAFISWVCGQAGRYFPVVVKLEGMEVATFRSPVNQQHEDMLLHWNATCCQMV
jgi:hypothetical protein